MLELLYKTVNASKRTNGMNGMGWDGMGWDGMGWDGMGWDGMGWDGMGWDGMGWDGMGWDGMGWDGMGWDGIDGTENCIERKRHTRCRGAKPINANNLAIQPDVLVP